MGWTNICNETDRLKVFGGWLVRTRSGFGNSWTYSMCLVPDPNHEWKV